MEKTFGRVLHKKTFLERTKENGWILTIIAITFSLGIVNFILISKFFKIVSTINMI